MKSPKAPAWKMRMLRGITKLRGRVMPDGSFFDPSPAEKDISIIRDDRLPGRNRQLRLVEFDGHFVAGHEQGGRLRVVVVANLRRTSDRFARGAGAIAEPVHFARDEATLL